MPLCSSMICFVTFALLLHYCFGDIWICNSEMQDPEDNDTQAGQLVIKEPRKNFLYDDRQGEIAVKVIPRRPVKLECFCYGPYISQVVTIGPSSSLYNTHQTDLIACLGPDGEVCRFRIGWSQGFRETPVRRKLHPHFMKRVHQNNRTRWKRATIFAQKVKYKVQTVEMPVDEFIQCNDGYDPYGNVNVVHHPTVIRCDDNYKSYDGPSELYEIPLHIKCPELHGMAELEVGDTLDVRAEWIEPDANMIPVVKSKEFSGFLIY